MRGAFLARERSSQFRERSVLFPYPSISAHAVIGDRRSAALVAADGTVDWWCVPHYSSDPIFGAILDAERGGYFRFGPAARALGRQRYVPQTATVETRFELKDAVLVGTDLMPLRERDGSASAIVRRLTARGGTVHCVFDLKPRFDAKLAAFCTQSGTEFDLADGEEAWAVIEWGAESGEWSPARARRVSEETAAHWARWARDLELIDGARRDRMRRSLITIRLLTYAPTGCAVAAPTTSLPERIGGDENWDYRLSWVRDNSLAIGALALHGDLEAARGYFDWLEDRESSTDAPLQVVYGIDGTTDLTECVREDFAGYRGSTPVRLGNWAYRQRQPGALGYFVDCAASYLAHGGPWREDYFALVARCADYVAEHWGEPDNGIWELPALRDHVSSRVMCWVALERAVKVARALGHRHDTTRWRKAMREIHAEVLAKGYSTRRDAFVHAYGVEALDAATLLIPIMGFLPADDPRVRSTVDRIASELTIDGFVHRFAPREIGFSTLAMGECEGAYLLCTCWLATVYAMDGRLELANTTLERIERVTGELGLMPEGIDARSGEFRGNYPLLFSHAEYVRAVVSLARFSRERRGAEALPRE
jgi:GH15 family glucan-1,4-alpha-glucosidase